MQRDVIAKAAPTAPPDANGTAGEPYPVDEVDPMLLVRAGAESSVNVKLTQQTKIDFEKLMASPEGRERLADYAAAELADENIRFYIAVQQFKQEALQVGETGARTPRGDVDGSRRLSADLEQSILEEDALVRGGAALIDQFLCGDAETLVNLPSKMMKAFEQPSAIGGYRYSATMFDAMAEEIFKLIRNDTFARFKYSDLAEELLWDLPMLGVTKAGFTKAFSGERPQRLLKTLLMSSKELTGADRVTAWLIDGPRMWSIASTNIGNALIEIPLGAGLAGQAAVSGVDIVIEDAYKDARFNQEVDKKLGYRTRSMLCVPLKRPIKGESTHGASTNSLHGGEGVLISPRSAVDARPATVVLQMLNKIGEDLKQKVFSKEDADTIREQLEGPFVDAIDLIALTADRRPSFVEKMFRNAELAQRGLSAADD